MKKTIINKIFAFCVIFCVVLAQTPQIANAQKLNYSLRNPLDAQEGKITFYEQNKEQTLEMRVTLDKKEKQIGETFFVGVFVRYAKDLIVQVPGPLFDFEPFHKKNYVIKTQKEEKDAFVYEIVYELSKLSLEPLALPEIFVEYREKNQSAQELPKKLFIKEPLVIKTKRTIDEKEADKSTIGKMLAPFSVERHLTGKNSLITLGVIAILTIAAKLIIFVIKKIRERRIKPFPGIKKSLDQSKKRIFSQKYHSHDEIKKFHHEISLLAKKALATALKDKKYLGMTANELKKALLSLPPSENFEQKEKFVNFFEKGEKIKYSPEEANLDESLLEIKEFISFFSDFIKKMAKQH